MASTRLGARVPKGLGRPQRDTGIARQPGGTSVRLIRQRLVASNRYASALFRDMADYSATPGLAPPTPITGVAAFRWYMEHTLPFLRERGGDLLFVGTGGPWLIRPPNERWDMAMLVRQQSVESFLAFAGHEAYLAGMGHRTAAIEDSRLLPLSESDFAMRSAP